MKYIIISIMLFLTCTVSASTYTFVTNSGTFILDFSRFDLTD